MTATGQPTSFPLYRCTNPETNCDYPFLGVAQDGSVLLALGDYHASFEWDVPDDLGDWLAHDFVATDAAFTCDLSTLQQLVRATFGDDTEFLSVSFDKELQPKGVCFSLTAQKTAEEGPEYLVQERRSYRRISRIPKWDRAVTPPEQALLDVCVVLATELAAEHRAALQAPSPLSRRVPAPYQQLNGL